MKPTSTWAANLKYLYRAIDSAGQTLDFLALYRKLTDCLFDRPF
jgi:transposase-like protein